MTNVFEFPKKGSNDNGPTPPAKEPTKPPPHMFEVTYLDGTTEVAPGYLSVGPIFVAVVDGQEFVELVVATDAIRSVRKLCTVQEWNEDNGLAFEDTEVEFDNPDLFADIDEDEEV